MEDKLKTEINKYLNATITLGILIPSAIAPFVIIPNSPIRKITIFINLTIPYIFLIYFAIRLKKKL